MIKKRAILYFLVMAFPMGLGAGASTWLKLPRLPLPNIGMVSRDAVDPPAELVATTPSSDAESVSRFPDFSAMHPLVVGSFSLLLCCGILLAADQSGAREK
jgi:hypothetical protein